MRAAYRATAAENHSGNRPNTAATSACAVRSVEITDSKNRPALTRGHTQADLGKEFGVAVCTKGRFYDNGAYPAAGQEPRLSLEISGKDAVQVAACEQKVVALANCGSLALPRNAPVPQGDCQRAQVTSLVRLPSTTTASPFHFLFSGARLRPRRKGVHY